MDQKSLEIVSGHHNKGRSFTLSEIFRRHGRDISTWAVKLDMEAPPEMLTILKRLQEAGHKDPVVFGGALRDAYLLSNKIVSSLPPSDIDVALSNSKAQYDGASYHFDETNTPTWLFPSYMATYIEETLPKNIDGFTSAKIMEAHTYNEFEVCMKTSFEDSNGNSSIVDLCFSGQSRDPDLLAISGDAPINSIAMDAKGNIYAHPLFEKHAKTLTYSCIDELVFVNEKRPEQRFKALKEKLPGLKNIGHHDKGPETFSEHARRLQYWIGL